MPPLRILFFTATSSPTGGVQSWLSHFAQTLAAEGHEPIAALTKGPQHNDPHRFIQFHPHLEHVVIDGSFLPRSSRIEACLRQIQRLRPHLVFPLGVVDAVPACALAKQSRREMRVILRTQGVLPSMLADIEDNQGVFDIAVCNGLLNAAHLLRRAGFPRERLLYVPNAAHEPTHLRLPRVPGSPIRLIYVGRLTHKDKRVLDLPDFHRQLSTAGVAFELKVVGDGPAGAELRAALTGRPNVTFTGHLDQESIYRDVFPHADCLLSFSSSESFGISIVEAMAHGVVPVTSQFVGWKSVRTIIPGTTALTFPVGDTARATAAVCQLAEDDELLESISSAAALHAREKFNWERCIDGWRRAIRTALELAPRERPSQFKALSPDQHGRLDRLPLPRRIVHLIRTFHRGAASHPRAVSGEEWPLFMRWHSPDRLSQIEQFCHELQQDEFEQLAEELSHC